MSLLPIITKGFKSMKCCRLLHFNILPLLLIKTSIMGLSAEVAEIMCIFVPFQVMHSIKLSQV